MNILIAPNAFKNSLGAAEAAEAIREGLMESKLQCKCYCFPVGDGGDGTAELILHHCNGVTLQAEVNDPLGRKINSSFGLIDDDKTAVIEMSNASGLRLLQANELNPLHANSYGTGELIKHALEKGVSKIILCIGGSATVDGGAGILQALGFRFFNKKGEELKNIPESLVELDRIEFSETDKRIMLCKIVVLCDVENVLLGKEGAAYVFGPQKGADPAAIIKLEAALTKLRDVVFRQSGKDMALIKQGGAAGGTAASLAVLLNAELVNGIEHFLSITGFDDFLEKATIVITGEGCIDMQTLQGKGPYGVARRAKKKGLRVIGLAGEISLASKTSLQQYFDVLLSINHETIELSEALKQTRQNLKQTATIIGKELALQIS